MNGRNRTSSASYIDVIFNLLLGITLMFFLAFLIIKPEIEGKKIDSKAEFIVTLDWPDHHNGDVDLWVLDPNGFSIGYQSKEHNVTALERDDIGSQSDTHRNRDGSMVYDKTNSEIITVRGIVKGEWTVNVHYYISRPIPDDHISGEVTPPYKDKKKIPVLTTVKVIRLNPIYKILFTKTVLLTRQGEERTMARFVIDEYGDVIEVIDIPRRFVVKRSGAFGGE